jgi:hypothetical protein
MPSFIYKEAPDVDYYVMWSSVVEAPVMTGNRAVMLAYLEDHDESEQRLERADATGTSSLWVENSGMRDRYPEEGSWDDDTYIYKQQGILTRALLFELCHRTDLDPDIDVSDLLASFEDEHADG